MSNTRPRIDTLMEVTRRASSIVFLHQQKVVCISTCIVWEWLH